MAEEIELSCLLFPPFLHHTGNILLLKINFDLASWSFLEIWFWFLGDGMKQPRNFVIFHQIIDVQIIIGGWSVLMDVPHLQNFLEGVMGFFGYEFLIREVYVCQLWREILWNLTWNILPHDLLHIPKSILLIIFNPWEVLSTYVGSEMVKHIVILFEKCLLSQRRFRYFDFESSGRVKEGEIGYFKGPSFIILV